MQCPKCYGDMDVVIESPINVERCNDCHGMYFEQLTAPVLESLGREVSIDLGDENVGAEYNEMVFVDCPKCNRMMEQRLVDEPVRIRFEICLSCHATFLDAGEYRTYVRDDHYDEFKKLLPPE